MFRLLVGLGLVLLVRADTMAINGANVSFHLQCNGSAYMWNMAYLQPDVCPGMALMIVSDANIDGQMFTMTITAYPNCSAGGDGPWADGAVVWTADVSASDPEQVWTEDGYTTPYHVYNATYLVDSDAQITLPNTDQATMGCLQLAVTYNGQADVPYTRVDRLVDINGVQYGYNVSLSVTSDMVDNGTIMFRDDGGDYLRGNLADVIDDGTDQLQLQITYQGDMDVLRRTDPDWAFSVTVFLRSLRAEQEIQDQLRWDPERGDTCNGKGFSTFMAADVLVGTYELTAAELLSGQAHSHVISNPEILMGKDRCMLRGAAVLYVVWDPFSEHVEADIAPCDNFEVFNVTVGVDDSIRDHWHYAHALQVGPDPISGNRMNMAFCSFFYVDYFQMEASGGEMYEGGFKFRHNNMGNYLDEDGLARLAVDRMSRRTDACDAAYREEGFHAPQWIDRRNVSDRRVMDCFNHVHSDAGSQWDMNDMYMRACERMVDLVDRRVCPDFQDLYEEWFESLYDVLVHFSGVNPENADTLIYIVHHEQLEWISSIEDSPLSCGSAKLREMFGQPNFAHRVARQHQQSWVTEMHGGNLFHNSYNFLREFMAPGDFEYMRYCNAPTGVRVPTKIPTVFMVSDEYLKVGVKVTDDNNNHHFAMAPAAALTQPHC